MIVPRVRLHAEGPEVSRLVWGLWRALKSEETRTPDGLARVIAQAVELGITSFDLADIYGGYACEALFGQALKRWGGDRRRIELLGKCDICLVDPARPGHRVKHYDTSAQHIARSVARTLDDLGSDYLDLLLLHRPDPLMDAAETAGALEALIRAGTVRHVGVSNHSPAQIDLLQACLNVPLVTNQIEFSVTAHTPLFDGTLDQAQRLAARPMAWSPLGGGALFAADDATPQPLMRAITTVMAEIGAEEPAQVALAWLLRHPSGVVPVIGTGRAARFAALAHSTALELSRQQWFLILEAARGQPVP